MRIALIGSELEENLALRYIHAAVTQAGHEAAIFDFHAAEQASRVVEDVLRFAPQAVGLSMVFTARAREFLSLAGDLRQAGYAGHITAGGHFASFHAEELLRDYPAMDSILHGEGEEAMVDLAAHLDRPADVAGITCRVSEDQAGKWVQSPFFHRHHAAAGTRGRPGPQGLADASGRL